MEPSLSPLLFAVLLFIGMVCLLEVGRQLGIRSHLTATEGEQGGLGTVEGAVFALFGLIIAFAFSGAASRFNEKHMLIGDEVNAIGTAYLRLQLVRQESQQALQELLREYVDSRLETYRRLPDMRAAEQEMQNSKRLQDEIWAKAVAATRMPGSHPSASVLLLPALNAMFDISTTRTMALQLHPPRIIYGLLFGLGLIASLLAGYRMATATSRSWMHILGFSVLTVVIVYVMLDIEYPRTGLIRLQGADQQLILLRESMK
jgi:hypothetical protein